MLDGIRGVAILLVIIRHCAPNQFGGGGFAGVDLFFVLSGYLITSLLIEEQDEYGTISLGRFYTRRALRLLPALYAMLAVTFVFVLVTPFGLQRYVPWFAFAATYTTPFYQWFVGDGPPGPDSVWSLAVEEYFYLLWPLLLIGIRLALPSARIRVRMAVLTVLVAIFAVFRCVTWFQFGQRIYEMPWTWADGLLVGCLASVLWKARLLERVPAWLQWTSAVAVLAFVFYPNAKDAGFTYSIGLLLLALAGAVSILAAVNHPGRALSRALSWSWLRWFGTRSYSLYLWNANFLVPRKPYPIPRLLDIVIGVAVSLVLAELSFRYIETPALRLKRRFETRERRPIAGVSGTADPSAPPSPV